MATAREASKKRGATGSSAVKAPGDYGRCGKLASRNSRVRSKSLCRRAHSCANGETSVAGNLVGRSSPNSSADPGMVQEKLAACGGSLTGGCPGLNICQLTMANTAAAAGA